MDNEIHLSSTNDPGFIIFIALLIFLITFIAIFGKRGASKSASNQEKENTLTFFDIIIAITVFITIYILLFMSTTTLSFLLHIKKDPINDVIIFLATLWINYNLTKKIINTYTKKSIIIYIITFITLFITTMYLFEDLNISGIEISIFIIGSTIVNLIITAFLLFYLTKKRSIIKSKITKLISKDMIICIASYILTSIILFISIIFIIEKIICTRMTMSLIEYTIVILIISIYINKIILVILNKTPPKIKAQIIGIIISAILILLIAIDNYCETPAPALLTSSIILGLIFFIITLTTIKIIIPEKININQINSRLRELSIYAIILIATFFEHKLRTLGLAISLPQIIITIIKLNQIKTIDKPQQNQL